MDVGCGMGARQKLCVLLPRDDFDFILAQIDIKRWLLKTLRSTGLISGRQAFRIPSSVSRTLHMVYHTELLLIFCRSRREIA